MVEEQSWDWETGEKRIPFGEWKENFRWVEEPYVSPDGEKIAAIVNIDEGQFSVCVNGESLGNRIRQNLAPPVYPLRPPDRHRFGNGRVDDGGRRHRLGK